MSPLKDKRIFRAVIIDAGGGGAFVRIPFDVEEEYGKKRVPVRAIFDREPYRGTLVRYGEPNHMLAVLKEIRRKIGKDIGDEVEVTLVEDAEPRVVEIPPDLKQALQAAPAAKAAFEKMSYTHQRETVRAILEAKHESTRQARLTKTIEMLLKGKWGAGK